MALANLNHPHPNPLPAYRERGPDFADFVLRTTDRFRWGFFAFIALGYGLAFTGRWRPEPDSALYLTLGRNLALGRGYTYHGEPHHLAYPGWPWILSIVFRTCGSHAVFVAQLLMLLMGVASLTLIFRLIRLNTGRPLAVLVTCGVAISYTFFRYCFELRSDMPFMLGVCATLAGYEGLLSTGSPPASLAAPGSAGGHVPREGPLVPENSSAAEMRHGPHRHIGNTILFLAGLLFAAVTRPTMWALLIALALAAIHGTLRGRLGKRSLLTLVALALAAGLFLHFDPRRSGATHGGGEYEDAVLSALNVPTLLANLRTLFDPMAASALFGTDFGDAARVGPVSLAMLFSGIALAAGLLAFRRRFLWGVWFTVTALMMVCLLARDRYFLPVLPMMVLGWWTMIAAMNHRLPRRSGNTLFVACYLLGIVLNAGRDGSMLIEQRHANPRTAIRAGRYESIDRVAAMIDANVPPDGWVIGPQKFGRILTFLADRKVVESDEVAGHLSDVWPRYYLGPADANQPQATDPPTPPGKLIAELKGPFDKRAWQLFAAPESEKP